MNRSEHIINVANRLILEKGYSAFSYADVAAEIGIQKASIHYHFPSKANLVQNVVGRYRQEVRANLNKLNSLTDDPGRNWNSICRTGSHACGAGPWIFACARCLPPRFRFCPKR